MKKRFLSIVLALSMIISVTAALGRFSAADSDTVTTAASADYGLGETPADGNILQCFNWTLSQISEELPNIAEGGFTSVQTSPLQPHDGSTKWYWLYQPTNFTIGNELGTYDELKDLCTKAHTYGVHIIVDVVANHVAGSNNGSIAYKVDSSLKKTEYYHNQGPCSNYDNRSDVIYKNIGMPDLNSEHKDIQDKVANMVQQLINAGVDGIRWDAAKHIGLPSEECDFWSRMAEFDIYQYGEILNAPAGDSGIKTNKPLMNEYAQYIGVSDDKYSSTIMTAVRDGNIAKSTGYWNRNGVSSDRLVYWAESHDTFSNNGGWTKTITQNKIDRAYAILAAREGSQTLYLSRPSSTNHESIYYGTKGSTHFTSKEVAAANHFHNAMKGTAEKYYTGYGCYTVGRERGAVIVSMNSQDIDVSVSNSGAIVEPGTYIDEISGSTFTVTEKTITGHIGPSGIAVFYKAEESDYMIGDSDLDGEITMDDVTYIQRHMASLTELSADQLKAADADTDGKIDLTDATVIQWYLADMKLGLYNVGKLKSSLSPAL